jgi:hypothetical protein
MTTRNALQDELYRLNEQLSLLDERFDLVEDDDLIEALIYERKALYSRYSHLIKLMRTELQP